MGAPLPPNKSSSRFNGSLAKRMTAKYDLEPPIDARCVISLGARSSLRSEVEYLEHTYGPDIATELVADIRYELGVSR